MFHIIFSSCKTSQLYINATDPAPVVISDSIKKVGVVSRTNYSLNYSPSVIFRQELSEELLKLTQESSAESVKGLTDALLENRRFEIIRPFTDTILKAPDPGLFSSPLSWTLVDSICKTQDVDLLFVLEEFSSDLRVVPLNVPPPGINPIVDLLNTAMQARVNIITTVRNGWRIYDPSHQLILDEFPMMDELIVTAGWVNIVNLQEAMLTRKDAIKKSSYKMAHSYAYRTIPRTRTLTREYYVRGTDNFKMATRKVKTGNWSGAGELWLMETKSSKKMIAGRAAYNMAILSEINGDIENAISWAKKAYEDYNNNLALIYVSILKKRLEQNGQRNQ
ncbi:MAG: hypothetical protein H7141_02045 [Burkholderiales bacterium]|nr:hypothetical protein [Bacteroidia bacterium]